MVIVLLLLYVRSIREVAKNSNNKNKGIGYGSIVIAGIVIFVGWIFFKYQDRLELMIQAVSGRGKNAFDAYEVAKRDFGGQHQISYKDVIVSSADMDRETYYRFDLTVILEKNGDAVKLRNEHKQAVNMIRSVVIQYRTNEMRTPDGRIAVKKKIREELKRQFDIDNIKGVYFENLVHN